MSLAEQFLGLRLSRAGQPITPVEKAQALEAARAALSAFAPGAGTKPSDVANFVVHQVMQRLGKEAKGTHFEGEPT